MKTYKIVVIPSDGIAQKVLTEGMKVLKRVAELDGTFRIEEKKTIKKRKAAVPKV